MKNFITVEKDCKHCIYLKKNDYCCKHGITLDKNTMFYCEVEKL